jgi:DNA-binding LacI/PurR family transcriptional regulator
VSRTINRDPSVQPQLAKRVLKVVEETGYFPSARALVSGRRRIFGLIVSEITNPFFPEIVHVFEETAIQHNYEILVTSAVHDTERMEIAVSSSIASKASRR